MTCAQTGQNFIGNGPCVAGDVAERLGRAEEFNQIAFAQSMDGKRRNIDGQVDHRYAADDRKAGVEVPGGAGAAEMARPAIRVTYAECGKAARAGGDIVESVTDTGASGNVADLQYPCGEMHNGANSAGARTGHDAV